MTKTTQNLRIIPLGGLEEVGRNMMVLEYDKDIIIIDMGLQFPEEDMPGIDYIIPNTAYLKDKRDKIRGVIITHGHYDHIGAIPHSMGRLGNPPIYTARLTRGMILKRQEDYPQSPKLNIHEVKPTDKIQLGCFRIEFFHVNHNIPDALGLIIETPVGVIVHTGDFKFDHSPVNERPADLSKIAQLGEKGVLVLMSDSTDAEVPGHSISETEIQKNLEEIFEKLNGRIITATFASLLTRVQQIIWLAEKFNRKVVVEGYSMKANVEIAKELGYLKVQKGTLITAQEANKMPDNKVLILCTGAQGEGNAVLMRLATGEHRFLKIHPNDTIIFSSSVVPGNERTIQNLRDALWRKGARVIHYKMMDVHAGGHAPIEDLKMMLNLIKPKFFMPIEGNYFMLKLHEEIAQSVGVKPENIIIPNNGQVVLLNQKNIALSKEKVPANYVMVDGLGVGDIGQVVLRDRQMMAQDGMFVIIAVIDSKTGQVRGEPDIISRGFVYLRESKELLDKTRAKVKEIVAQSSSPEHTTNWAYVKDNIREKIGQFLYTKTQRRPMVLPVVIEI
ncbi:MAG: ribonuclease J [Candidatus Portnoybacteria bacterium RIFCSPHIGHO2_12_FULL_40_11]|uniref:Ribonuclease J n=1 Tax=Candidatus Portnoybacteria bacterium RIFCSPHIGHO2_12_FULL_40_11 TaxID=1801998 RepID=A0A1G2FM98_9BACT|nr:MAG: ribonuclease J [Candidatus Portnoybacteria bacterium RIFCSPHIGHO2_12_FULL_40_11]